MKRKLTQLLVALVVVLVALTSCSTTIALNTLVPAKVDVSGYKTMAVMSTQDNSRWNRPSFWNSFIPVKSVDPIFMLSLSLSSGLDFSASTTIADAATDMITKAVDTGISYKVIPPNLTDAYITVGTSNNNLRKVLMDNGIDAILKTEITQVYYDEYISQETDWVSSKDKAGRPYNKKRFYLVQQYAISLSYTLTDVENNKIIATSTFASDTREKKTQIGHTEDATDRFYEDYYTITSASQLLRNLIKEFTDSFRAELSPHYVTEYFTFFPNKPKEKSLESAYDALDDQKWNVALRMFADEYARSGHYNAGLNAAILYFANGEADKAFDLTQEIYKKTGSSDALDLYYHFKTITDRENAANKQINSTEKSGATAPNSSSLIGF
jgi:hypothetical protein